MTTDTIEFGGHTFQLRPYVPEGHAIPTTALEALKAARELLAEEGRWVSGHWFQNAHPEVDPEDPFCNSWAVCAQGAIGVVTVGAVRENREENIWLGKPQWTFDDTIADWSRAPRNDVYAAAVEVLKAHLPFQIVEDWDEELGDYVQVQSDERYDTIPEWNDADHRDRTQVLAIFDEAIEALEQEAAA